MHQPSLDLRRYPVTQRQLEFLSLIRNSIAENGFPPTRAEMAKHFGFKSPNGAQTQLESLVRKGLVILDSGAARGIRLTKEALALVPVPDAERVSLFGSGVTDIPVVGNVAAGMPILSEAHIQDAYPLPSSLFRVQPDYFLVVRGESMINAGILDGDLVAIKAAKDARNHQIVVARLEGEVTLKRLSKQGASVQLVAENPTFKPIQVTSEDFCIEGVMVGLVRRQESH